MRITGLGHAGMFIETRGGSILCDPWSARRSSARGSRSPTTGRSTGRGSARPTSSTSRTGTATTSTLRCIERYVPKDIKVLLPDYPTDDLEHGSAQPRLRQHHLHAGGRGRSSAAPLRLMVTPLRAPSDGPIGDSSLSRRRRHRQHPEPERLAPARPREAAVVRQARGVLHAVLRRDLVADGLRPRRTRRSRTSPTSSAKRSTSARCTTSRRSMRRTSSRWRARRCSCATSCSATTGSAWRTTRSSPTSGVHRAA